MNRPGRPGVITYWSLAVALTVFGFLDLIAIGAPFFLTGVAMLVAGRWRRKPPVIWPALAGVWAFVLGYALVAPPTCQTGSGMDPISICSYAFGLIRWHGSGSPSLMPAFLAGCLSAAIGTLVTRRLLVRRVRASILG